ncbi:hypothetical protein DEIPH_ctg006orf0004 [Deinococcus phoenicis]|uniref:Uncharacterized protein n=1 Tax=Deinococcus phoenicis TaxID=1476583 RepID=A0A016QTJ6_9DEIO|nr:hypothetical protein [Deinococcus phoenicis]EYB69440.1 hypothetical protein DEIPH_ctg006orf0004 [Deinococcus phoenicis]
MLPGLLVTLLVLLNLGGLASILLQFGHGDWLPGLGSLALVVLLDALGFWLLRELRENG